MDYPNAKYMELKTECAKRGLGGGGKRNELIDKLVADDLGIEAPVVEEDKPPVKLNNPKLKPNDANPDNPNYDIAGRWRRRLKGWLAWRLDGTAIYKE
jgi:hypothetical protein